MGSVGTASDPSTTTASFLDQVLAVNPGTSGLSQSLLGSIFSSSVIANYSMIAVGVFLVLGALLISQNETVVQVASTAARAAA